jgi:hypothetical protein
LSIHRPIHAQHGTLTTFLPITQVLDEADEAALRDSDIIREKDDQMNALEQGTKKERQKTIEHQMVLEKAIREEHAARVSQVASVTKQLDRINHDIVALVDDERLARESKESKLRGQITTTLGKLHDANRDTNERLDEERDSMHQILKTEIESRMTTMDAMNKVLVRATTESERLLAAGRVEAAQAVRTTEVKLSRRLAATEGRVEVEVAALRKLYVLRLSQIQALFAGPAWLFTVSTGNSYQHWQLLQIHHKCAVRPEYARLFAHIHYEVHPYSRHKTDTFLSQSQVRPANRPRA